MPASGWPVWHVRTRAPLSEPHLFFSWVLPSNNLPEQCWKYDGGISGDDPNPLPQKPLGMELGAAAPSPCGILKRDLTY
jgi:hypothetical protein